MTSQEIRNKAQKRPVCLKLPPPWPSESVGRLAFSGSGHHYGTTLLPAVGSSVPIFLLQKASKAK